MKPTSLSSTVRISAILIASSLLSLGASGGCDVESATPEVHTYFGSKDSIQERIAAKDFKLSERRVYLQVTEGDAGTSVKLYEHTKDGSYSVSQWTGDKNPQVHSKLEALIFENKGVNCVGEQVKAFLKKEFPGIKETVSVPAPTTNAAALFHSVKESKGDFIKTTVYLLC